MPEPRYLPAYRFRIAYGLSNDSLVELLRTAYFQKGANIYALWTRARDCFWNYTLGQDGTQEAIFKAPFPEIPNFMSSFPIHISAEHVLYYIIMLSRKISIEAVQLGIDEVIKSTYNPYVFKQHRDYGLLLRYIANPKRKYRIGKSIPLSVSNLSMPESLYLFFQDIFCNAIVLDVDIFSSILGSNGYKSHDAISAPYLTISKQQEKEIISPEQGSEKNVISVQSERSNKDNEGLITNKEPTTCSPAEQSTIQPEATPTKAEFELKPYPLPHPIPKVLWDRMSQEKIITNMRAHGCPDEEIAYVLRVEKDELRQDVGKLLYTGKGEDISTYYRRWKTLRESGIKMGIPFPPEKEQKKRKTKKKTKKKSK